MKISLGCLVLQVRAVGCVLIVAVMRLLNLAVPILYRDVVNTMADVSSKTHPPPGQQPQHFTFKQARPPRSLHAQALQGEACLVEVLTALSNQPCSISGCLKLTNGK